MYTTFSIQIAGSVLKRAIACDRVRANRNPCLWVSLRLHQYTVFLVSYSSIFAHCDSELVQIVFNFFHILSSILRVHAAKSSGNSTLSCNVGSTTFFPECPWIARKYNNLSDEQGFKQYWKLLFFPPPFARKVIQAWTVHCEEPSNFYLELFNQVVKSDCSIIFSRNGSIMSQESDHEFWYSKTTLTACCWIDVYPNSFVDRNIIGRQIHNRFWSWPSFCSRSPRAYVQLNAFNGHFFWRFCHVFVDSIHDANPTNCSVSKWRFRS